MNVVLVEPEIPQNTGNIARTCAATGSTLHLVGRLGFSLEEKHIKRAGLDYWPLVQIRRHASLEELFEQHPDRSFWLASTRGGKCYDQAAYCRGDFLVFGKETAGLPRDLLDAHRERVIRIPMRTDARSLNLSNSVAIVLYEALRQLGFPEML